MASVLTHEQKTFVVQQLAMWRTPQQVVELVKEEFDIEISRQLAHSYHPEHGRDLAEIWKILFRETRSRFLETVSEIPIANQSYRLRQLQDSLDRVVRSPKKNEAMVHSILEQAAKESGGMYTNRRELTGANGKPLLDTVELAKMLVNDLVTKDDFTREEAVSWVANQYKVPEDVLVSDANN